MAKILSKGITLSCNGDANIVPGLLEVPDFGGSPEKVDVTTLSDANRQYIDGIKDYGDLTFKFVYDSDVTVGEASKVSNYDYLDAMINTANGTNTPIEWKITYKGDKGKNFGFKFNGYGSLTMDAMSVNSALTFTLTIAVSSDVEYFASGSSV